MIVSSDEIRKKLEEDFIDYLACLMGYEIIESDSLFEYDLDDDDTETCKYLKRAIYNYCKVHHMPSLWTNDLSVDNILNGEIEWKDIIRMFKNNVVEYYFTLRNYEAEE